MKNQISIEFKRNPKLSIDSYQHSNHNEVIFYLKKDAKISYNC